MDLIAERSGCDTLTAAGHRVVHGGEKISFSPLMVTFE
jgi:acetate kinase